LGGDLTNVCGVAALAVSPEEVVFSNKKAGEEPGFFISMDERCCCQRLSVSDNASFVPP